MNTKFVVQTVAGDNIGRMICPTHWNNAVVIGARSENDLPDECLGK